MTVFPSCVKRRLAWLDRYIICAALILASCLGVTARVVAIAVEEWVRSRQLAHASNADASMRALKGSVHSAMTAAFAARSILMKQFSPQETVGWSGLHDMLDAVGGTFAPVNQSFATWAVLSTENRTTFEAEFTARCAQELGVQSITIARLNTSAMSGLAGFSSLNSPVRAAMPPAPASHSGMYPVLTRYWSGAGTLQVACSNEAFDLSSSAERMIAFSRSVDTGRITWLQQHITSEKVFKNIGMLVPVHAPSDALAGSAGRLHAAWIQHHRNRTNSTVHTALRSVCKPPLGVGPDDCGLASRSIGVMAIPLYVESALPDIEDVLGVAGGTHFSVIEVSSWRDHIKPNVVGDKERLQFLLTATTLMPLLPDDYYMDTRTDTYSSLVQKGTVGAILRKAKVEDVVSANALLGKNKWQHRMDPGQALADAIRFDEARDSLQATYVFILGRRVYFLILRDVSETALGPDGHRQMLVSATLGMLCSIMLACVPLIIRYIHDSNAKRTAHQMDLVQAERDGVVQAVAFAAHEIRNPMHGVLASLESAAEDLAYLRSLLQRVLGRPDAMKEKEQDHQDGGQDDAVSHELVALLGQDTCQEILNAVEDGNTAKSSAESCHRLVNDMIDYSKLQRGAMALQTSDMDVAAGLKRLILGQRGFVPAQVTTLLGIDPALPARVLVDEVRVLQVLTNSLTNAGKFTAVGSIYVTATIVDSSSSPALCLPHNPGNRWLAITTCDTGKGLNGINVDGLFEPVKASAASSHPSAQNTSVSGAGYLPGRAVSEVHKDERGAPEEAGHSPSTGGQDVAAETGLSASSIAKTRGSGLGLPVARLMARALGGDIDLYTETYPDGTTYTRFLFVLPLSSITRNPDGTHPTVEPYPLFGRTGRLVQTSRAELRALVSKKLRELRHTLPDFYATIKSNRQGSFSTGKHSEHTHADASDGTGLPSISGGREVRSHPSQPTTVIGQGVLVDSRIASTSAQETVDGPVEGYRATSTVVQTELLSRSITGEPTIASTARVASLRSLTVPMDKDDSDTSSGMDLGGSKVGLSAVSLVVHTPDEGDARIDEGVFASSRGHEGGVGGNVRHDGGTGRKSTSTQQLTNYMLSARAPGIISSAADLATDDSVGPFTSGGMQSYGNGAQRALRVSEMTTAYGSQSTMGAAATGPLSKHVERRGPGGTEVVSRNAVSGTSLTDSMGTGESPIQVSIHGIEDRGSAVGMSTSVEKGIALGGIPLAGRTLRVLYAEDDATNRRLMDRMVTRSSKASMHQGGPVHLVTVENGWAALCHLYLHGHLGYGTLKDCFKQLSGAPATLGLESSFLLPEELIGPPLPAFDLICLDNEMPIANGSSVASVLREAQHKGEGGTLAHVPVVAVTGRCSGFSLLASYVHTCSMSVLDVTRMMPSVIVAPELDDEEFRASFVGTLGKPYKADDLAGLLMFARAVRNQLPGV